MGLGMSGTQDNSALYSQALQAVDGLCDTCASARNPDGNYFTVKLPVSWAVLGGIGGHNFLLRGTEGAHRWSK